MADLLLTAAKGDTALFACVCETSRDDAVAALADAGGEGVREVMSPRIVRKPLYPG